MLVYQVNWVKIWITMNLVRTIYKFLRIRPNWLAPVIIFSVGLILRLYKINIGILESAPNRQLIDAVWARNIFRGQYISDFMQGFQLYHWIVAMLYQLAGGVYEVLGRLVSVSLSFVGAIFFYRLLRGYFNNVVALVGLFFFFILSPIHIVMSRAFQVDMTALTLGIIAIYYLHKWNGRNNLYLVISAIFASLCFLTKITFAYLLLPIGYICYQKLGMMMVKRKELYLYLLGVFFPVFIWYDFSRQITLENSKFVFQATNWWQVSNWFRAERLLQNKFYVNIFYFFVQSVVTPIGLVLLPLVRWRRQKWIGLFYVWFGAALIYIVALSKVTISHEYYILVLVPPASALIGVAVNNLLSKTRISLHNKSLPMMAMAAFLAILATWRVYYFDIYRVPKKHERVLETAEKVKKFVPSQTQIITTAHNSAVLQYYTDRPGNYLVIYADSQDEVEDRTVKEFERFKRMGAKYYAISDVSELKENPIFAKHLEQFELLNPTDSDQFRIYRLQSVLF